MPPAQPCVAAGMDTPMTLLSCACAAGAARTAATASALKALTTPIVLRPLCCTALSPGVGAVRSERLLLALQHDGKNDDHALDGSIEVGAHQLREVEDVLDQVEDEHADDRAPDSAEAALQHRSADDDVRNSLELPQHARRRRGR